MITIKKYGNRRLYDTARSRYINLDELAEIVRNGEDVEVLDARTNEDLTREVLLQVVMEALHGGDLFPVPMLHRIIRSSGAAPWQQGIHQQLASGFSLLVTQMDQADKLFRAGGATFPGWGLPRPTPAPEPPPPPAPAPEPVSDPEPEPEPEAPKPTRARKPAKAEAEAGAEAELEELMARVAALEKRIRK